MKLFEKSKTKPEVKPLPNPESDKDESKKSIGNALSEIAEGLPEENRVFLKNSSLDIEFHPFKEERELVDAAHNPISQLIAVLNMGGDKLVGLVFNPADANVYLVDSESVLPQRHNEYEVGDQATPYHSMPIKIEPGLPTHIGRDHLTHTALDMSLPGTVSRNHLTISPSGSMGIRIEDHSTNGTEVLLPYPEIENTH